MDQNPNIIEQLMQSPQAAKLLQNSQSLAALANSPDAQKLMQLLREKGPQLQAAAEAAKKGDPSRLTALLQEVSSDPDGAKAVEGLRRNIPM